MADKETKTKAEAKAEKTKGPKFCPCGKQAVNFGDAVGLQCPQHFTSGEDLVDSAPTTGDFLEADEGTNKGATELAVQEPKMSDAGKKLAKDPTQENRPVEEGSAEAQVGNSEEATTKADAKSGNAKTSGGDKLDTFEKGSATKAADKRAGIDSKTRADDNANTASVFGSKVTSDTAAGAKSSTNK